MAASGDGLYVWRVTASGADQTSLRIRGASLGRLERGDDRGSLLQHRGAVALAGDELDRDLLVAQRLRQQLPAVVPDLLEAPARVRRIDARAEENLARLQAG